MNNIDLSLILSEFNTNYNFLYEHEEFIDTKIFPCIFDYLVNNEKYFKDIVISFNAFRGDFISSDREATSFILALKSYGIIKDIKVYDNNIDFIFNDTQY